MDEVIIRDFIYLDTDTLGSIISQLEKGLIKDLIPAYFTPYASNIYNMSPIFNHMR